MVRKEEIFNDEEKTIRLARIVAHLMGDGCVSGRYLRYNNKNKVLLNNFEKYFEIVFGKTHFIRGKSNSGTLFTQIQNKKVLEFLKSLVEDYRSYTLSLPTFINTKELQKEFLSAFYDDEGSAPLRIFKKTGEIKRNISLSSNSEKLLMEIKEILQTNFGIKSNKILKYVKIRDNKHFTNYLLNITGKSNLDKFKEEIDFTHPDKKERLKSMVNSYKRLSATI